VEAGADDVVVADVDVFDVVLLVVAAVVPVPGRH